MQCLVILHICPTFGNYLYNPHFTPVFFSDTFVKNSYTLDNMPTQKPRIAITVPDEINQTLERLYELTGTPKSKLIVEMLEQYVPVLEQVVDTLEKIKSDKENGKEIAKKFAQDMLFDGQEMLGVLASEAKKI